MVETVLVTGGSGFVAGWCIVGLLRRGYVVRTTVRGLAKQAGVRAAVASVVDPGERLTCFAADLTKTKAGTPRWRAATMCFTSPRRSVVTPRGARMH
jgi:uncharacterized protein YbjT (DUF2867 family)